MDRRAFSLIEALVALTTISILSTIAVLRLTGSANSSEDLTAKSSLVVFQQIQQGTIRVRNTPLTHAAIENPVNGFERGSVKFVNGAEQGSTNSSQVAVRVDPQDPSVVVGTVTSGPDCWGLRLDFMPTENSPLQWWFLDEDLADNQACSPALFLNAIFPLDGTGQDPNTPTIID